MAVASLRFTKLGAGRLGSWRYLITAVDGDPCKEPEKQLLLKQLIGSGRGSSHANLTSQLSATNSLNFFPCFLFQGNFWPYFINNWSFPVFVFHNVSPEQNDQRSPFVSILGAQTKLMLAASQRRLAITSPALDPTGTSGNMTSCVGQ